ncbi:MAG: Glycosyl transferase group 1 [Candidatus Roizmanbacteria bacterium GW2011_GWA2_36_23]|uniref:Glycosyl transferase group 1 n=1 Tax=Candidatus Roizmanbacteria bacterium GW2011_GWA2_36_23 TaxID=1618480 RepID=A0A0G0EM35_9BACT|nr:MAG: Glycosyl transferase group 1 [Candidatus Roizmanbacteria bacterium GW2011_GWA2_36_23]
MRIGIDARLFFQTGVGTYIRNLIRNLEKNAPDNYQFYIYVLEEESSLIKFNNPCFIKRPVSYRWHTAVEQLGFLSVLYKDKLDLMHFTYFSYPVLYGKPFVATIHDITPLKFITGKASTKNPLLYKIKHILFKLVLKRQVEKARTIITPTETVKNELIKQYGVQFSSKIIALHEGINEELLGIKENQQLRQKFQLPFFIYVGNFYPHKNVENLVKAFSGISNNYKLLLIGPKDYFSARIKDLVRKLKLNYKIYFYHNYSLPDLAFFYKNALALVNPSFSEGFGLPLVEAVYFNCPVIASDIDVFKELLGDLYIKFNPNDPMDMRNKIKNFINNRPKPNYNKLSKRFSFKEMSDKTFNIYKNLLTVHHVQ